jgi:D-hydroxyproline dehydrogenase
MLNATPSPPRTALVAGGGIVGLACAFHLQRAGVRTVVIDPAPSRPASWGNAGHLATEQVEPLASSSTLRSAPRRLFMRGGPLALPARDLGAWLPFALRMIRASSTSRFQAGKAALASLLGGAIPAWRRTLAAIDAGSLMLEDGHFVAWETVSGARAGRAAWSRADTGTASFRDASAAELAALAACMSSPPADAIRFIGTGRILDPGELLERLAAGFAAQGGSQQRASVRQIRLRRSNAELLLDSGELLHADIVIVACGVGSATLLEPLGHKVPIVAERGYHIQSGASRWPIDLPPVLFDERSLLVVRLRSGLRATSFVEFGRAHSPADPRKWARLRNHVAALGLPFDGPGSEWMGARPTLPDYLPAIGRSARAANLCYAFGHQHLGLTLAAVTGEAVAALARGEPARCDLRAFDLERFA